MSDPFFDPRGFNAQSNQFSHVEFERKSIYAAQTLGLALTASNLKPSTTFSRVPTTTKPHKKNGAYVYVPGTFFFGFNWETDMECAVTNFDRPLDRVTAQKIFSEARKEADRIQETCSAETADLLSECSSDIDHAYVTTKGIKPVACLQSQNDLVIPMYDIDSVLTGCQIIKLNGVKRFKKGTRLKGAHTVLGNISDGEPILICEGWATGCSLHEATQCPVVVCFASNNILRVTQDIKSAHPNASLIVCADNDAKSGNDSNPGIEAGKKARAATGALLIWPHFHFEDSGLSDFNDVHCLKGIDELRNMLQATLDKARSR